jgi:hypothetical protein
MSKSGSALATDGEFEDDAVQDFINILEEHRRNCESQGKYVEAEIAKQRLEELKLHEENRRREAMRSRHIAERLGVEEAHMLEFQQFNMIWEKKMEAYEENAVKLIQSMKERHAAELQAFRQKLISAAPKPKFSKEYLNLRRIQEVLAKQGNYAEAAKMKNKADELMAWEEEKWSNQRMAEMYQKEMRFRHKLKAELVALKKRVSTGKQEQKKQRQRDLERLLQRYQNVKAELEQQQNLETIKAEKLWRSKNAARSMKH